MKLKRGAKFYDGGDGFFDYFVGQVDWIMRELVYEQTDQMKLHSRLRMQSPKQLDAEQRRYLMRTLGFVGPL
jgi:hypothetical protein